MVFARYDAKLLFIKNRSKKLNTKTRPYEKMIRAINKSTEETSLFSAAKMIMEEEDFTKGEAGRTWDAFQLKTREMAIPATHATVLKTRRHLFKSRETRGRGGHSTKRHGQPKNPGVVKKPFTNHRVAIC